VDGVWDSGRPLEHVRPRSRESPLQLPPQTWTLTIKPAPRSASASHAARVARRIGAPPAAAPLLYLGLLAADHRCLVWSLRRLCPKPRTVLPIGVCVRGNRMKMVASWIRGGAEMMLHHPDHLFLFCV